MVAASFFGSTAFLIVTIALVAVAAFGLGWLMFGTAARYKADKEMQARMQAIGRKVTTSGPQPVDKNAGGWIPENVVGFGRRFANSRGFAGRLDAELEAAGVSMRSGEFVVITVLALFVGGILGAALLRNPLLAIGIGLIAAIAPTAALRMALRKRAEKLRDQLPDVLTIMASSLRAGHSFLQSLDTVAKEIAQPAASEFQRVVAEIRLGRPADESLEAMAERVGSADFQWAVLAVNIQREVGGNLAEILDTVSDTLRERAQIRGQIRVLTSEGRLSAWVLGLMPVALGFYMFAVNPDYIGLLFTTTVGLVMLITAACLLVLGIFWMKKIVDIDV